MCDYSLKHLASRPAKVGEQLITRNFGTGTSGFCDPANHEVAVCVLPGTELKFDAPFVTHEWVNEWQPKRYSNVAIFRQVEKDCEFTHHDALETPDGQVVKLTGLVPDQIATVLQMPAAPKNDAEAKEQERLAIVA